MKSKMVLLSLLIALAGLATIVTRAQDAAPDDDVRGAFLTSRPKAAPATTKSTSSSKPTRRRPKATPTPKAGDTPTGGSTAAVVTPTKLNTPRIGMGLTLFATQMDWRSAPIRRVSFARAITCDF